MKPFENMDVIASAKGAKQSRGCWQAGRDCFVAPLLAMTAALLLAAAYTITGCQTTRYPEDRASSVHRTYAGVEVVGFFSDADVDAILAAVKQETSEQVSGVWPPYDSLNSFRRFETDALPGDSAEVFTLEYETEISSRGHIYYLSKHNGGWRVMGSRVFSAIH